MNIATVKRRVWEERRRCQGAYYCDDCTSTYVNAQGTVYFNIERQEWLEVGGDVDSWYCSDCGDEVSVSWNDLIQYNLWDEELSYVNS